MQLRVPPILSQLNAGAPARVAAALLVGAATFGCNARLAGAAEVSTAASGSPVWSSVDSASTHAVSADPTHALMTSVVQQRQLSPLRAARLFAVVRVAQSEAVRQLAAVGGEVVPPFAAALALSWMLPQENPTRWVAPALLQASRAGGITADTEERIRASVWPVLFQVIDDGADARRRPLVKPDPRPGVWLRTPPLFAEQPAEPQGANWKPWCPGSDKLEVAPAVQHGSPQWQEELKQVAATTAALTAEQKAIARRWHLDAGSITPPGVWNAIATSYLLQAEPRLDQRHRVLAVLNIAMQDALVAAWRIKFRDWSERPVTAIQRELDPAFEPLLVTPPFPGYVSGHATVSAAAAGVLSHYYPALWHQWWGLAREAAMSRLFGGIHFASDNEQGLALGSLVAQACLSAFGQAGSAPTPRLVTAPVGMSPDFFVLPRMRARPE